ncbi:E3 ubiquitin-protein ligase FANCL [Achroia grisella]|uniref:E3 ubiquitin-protein ligase FANCL n=1 Tax=Achroia grisella TaxID=688607 RepID=UPI0027D223C7|nr:E3 ubiquitin-protein ligase FANCL [Achroia grisella]
MFSLIQELISSEKCKNLQEFLERIRSSLESNIKKADSISSVLIDKDFFDEVKNIVLYGHIPLFFGKSLRDLKCIVEDDNNRQHEIYIHYNGPKKLSITLIYIPYSTFQDQEYSSIEDIIVAFKKQLSYLKDYLNELERIDRLCTVMEPVNPTFKDNYRRIFLDNRSWLHVEVTAEGLGNNISILGNSDEWSEKLQSRLMVWDHDKDIVENIMNVFDLINFASPQNITCLPEVVTDQVPVCNICLSVELPDNSGVPQPLCSNSICGVYFHRNCLFQWLVASSGGRHPTFGVASGNCPTCLKPISCSEKDG